jgi:hypothetical protein
MKQTAVEWLIEQVALNEHEEGFFLHTFLSNEEISKAKQMEKEQIMDAHRRVSVGLYTDAEQYYNETYGK